MPKISPLLLVVLFVTVPLQGEPRRKTRSFAVENALNVARGLTLVSWRIPIRSTHFTLRGPAGDDPIPYHYDRKEKRLWFQDRFKPKEKRSYTVTLGERSLAELPVWSSDIVKSKLPALRQGKKVVKSKRVVIGNGLLRVAVDRGPRGGTEVDLSVPGSDYRFRFVANGYTQGLLDAAHARDWVKIKPTRKFLLDFGVPKKVKIQKPNPFRRVIEVTCSPFARRNDGKTLDLCKESTVEITVEWGSPVVAIKSHRKLTEKHFTHNGFYLNWVLADVNGSGKLLEKAPAVPLKVEIDAETRGKSPRGMLPNVEKSFVMTRAEGRTILYQPDFRRIGIDRGGFVFIPKLGLLTALRPARGKRFFDEIPAGDYDDRVVIVCDVDGAARAAGGTSSWKAWVKTIDEPMGSGERPEKLTP